MEAEEKHNRKRTTNKSHAEAALGYEGKSRRLSVQCSLRKALQLKGSKVDKLTRSEKTRLSEFHAIANQAGLLRHLVGLIANKALLTSDDPTSIVVNKTFFDRCWSALDYRLDGSNKSNDFSPAVNQLIDTFGRQFDISSLGSKLRSFEYRSPICRDMETVAKKHLEFIQNRGESLLRYEMKRTILELCPELEAEDVSDLLQKAKKCFSSFSFDQPIETGYQQINTFVGAVPTKLVDDLRRILGNHLTKLVDTIPLDKCIRINSKKETIGLVTLDEIAKYVPHLLIPYAVYIESKLTEYLMDPACCYNSRNKLPKRFSILPIWKLQPAFVEYTATNLIEVHNPAFSVNKDCSKADLCNNLFNLKHIYELKKEETDWKVSNFKTDGVTLCLSLIASPKKHPAPVNMEHLTKAGYQIPIPTKKVNVIDSSQRGIYRDSQERSDIKKVKKEDLNGVTIVGVDPGQRKPISVSELKLSKKLDSKIDHEQIAECNFWEKNSKQFMEDCGRNHVADQEGKRRRKSFKYRFALEQLSQDGIRHRTCDSSIFDNYLESVGLTLKAMKLEKMRLARKKLNWLRKRKTRSTLDKIADELLLGANKKKEADETRVIFFGGGNWTPKKGSPAVPRKPLISRIASKGLCIVEDEYRTSKCCPCCGGEMQDLKGKDRVRCCKNSLNGNCSLTNLDRDRVGSLNIALCGAMTLLGHKRPEHLCRQPLRTKRDEKQWDICPTVGPQKPDDPTNFVASSI